MRPTDESQRPVRRVLPAAALLAAALSSAAAGDVPSKSKFPERYCDVPGVSVELERALCDARIHAFEILSEMSQSEATHNQATRILEQLWLRDSTLGDGLNWRLLGDEDFQAEVVSQLAQAIRIGWSTLPLQPLQDFATDYAQKYRSDGVTNGLGLIGDTDASSQFFLLKEAIKSPDRNTRGVVLGALGSMCSKNSLEFLRTLAGEKGGLNADDRKRAAAWLERRTTQMGKNWCAHNSVPPQKQKKGEV